jgi:hypothetical protein
MKLKLALVVLFIPFVAFGTIINAKWDSSEGKGIRNLVYILFTDSVDVTSADTVLTPTINLIGTDLHTLFIWPSDDSVKVDYRVGAVSSRMGDWEELTALANETDYTLYLDFANFLQIRLIGLGGNATSCFYQILIGKNR